jgi:excinuclease UvrABC nuclease subunit
MAKKTVGFNRGGAARLPNNKPVVYRIKTAGGKTNYVGVAKRGRAQERIQEHLEAGKIPGAIVQIEQFSSIAEAQKKEQDIIAKSQPKYNDQGR